MIQSMQRSADARRLGESQNAPLRTYRSNRQKTARPCRAGKERKVENGRQEKRPEHLG